MSLLLLLAIIFFTLILASLPLYLALKFLGEGRSMLNVIAANILAGIVTSVLGIVFSELTVTYWFVYLIATLFVYKSVFDISWGKALVAWILAVVFLIIIVFLLLGFLIVA